MKIKLSEIEMNYEVSGSGPAIILIHGNGENNKIFDIVIKELEKTHTVYAIDSRGHGESSKGEITYNNMAQDTIEFIRALNIEKPIIYGFSDGGIIALLVAIKEKDLLSKIIISGANVTVDGINKNDLRVMKIIHFITRSKKIKMMLKEPNISYEELQSITIPVNVLAGEFDAIVEEHTKYIANSIKNSTLEIIPGETHASYIVHSDKLYPIIKKYLNN